MGLDEREEIRIEAHAVLHNFSQSAAKFAVGKRDEEGGVNPNADGLMKRADQVLCIGVIDAYFAANRAVHHGEKRGGNHQQRQSARVCRGHKSGLVADHTAADGNDQRFSIGLKVGEMVVQFRGAGQALLCFSRRQNRLAGANAGAREY